MFRPFIRFRNGYNGRTPFSVFFGFERSACTNGMIYEEKIAGIKVSHDTQDIAREIERKIQKANFRRVPETFRHRLTVLCGVPVPRDLFTPVIHRVLGIRPPKEGSNERCQRAWADLQAVVERVSDRYVKEFEATAYALMNALSDLATGYPFAQGGFVRRGATASKSWSPAGYVTSRSGPAAPASTSGNTSGHCSENRRRQNGRIIDSAGHSALERLEKQEANANQGGGSCHAGRATARGRGKRRTA